MEIKDKNIVILGAVRSGIGAAKLAKRLGANPFVSDISPFEKMGDAVSILETENIPCEFGQHSEKVYNADLVIISPGIPSNVPVVVELKKRGIKIVSELEFASWYCKGNIIAITGTNGKTTTTTLTAYMLNECGVKCHLAGNIGLAFSEIADSVLEEEYVALEVSSFQLDFIDNFKPLFSMILNITPDHLDRYNNNFQEYIAAKALIFKNQDENCYFIYNVDDNNIPVDRCPESVNKLGFSLMHNPFNGTGLNEKSFWMINQGEEKKLCTTDEVSLRGEHNYANILAVLNVAMTLNLIENKVQEALAGFPGVEHRLEFVRELNGVKYINDSKATNVDAVWYALRSFEDSIILILGGKDKGNDYTQIEELVKTRVKKIYAIGSSADKIYEFFHNSVPVHKMQTMEDCVADTEKTAVAGDILLLSPACASFDMYDNFEHRGQVFKEAVNKL